MKVVQIAVMPVTGYSEPGEAYTRGHILYVLTDIGRLFYRHTDNEGQHYSWFEADLSELEQLELGEPGGTES